MRILTRAIRQTLEHKVPKYPKQLIMNKNIAVNMINNPNADISPGVTNFLIFAAYN